jgi:hypothetical protein
MLERPSRRKPTPRLLSAGDEPYAIARLGCTPARPGGTGIGARQVNDPSSITAVLASSVPTAVVVATSGRLGGGAVGHPEPTFVVRRRRPPTIAATLRAFRDARGDRRFLALGGS